MKPNVSRPEGLLWVALLNGHVVAKAKEAGGDAIIIESNENKVTGYTSSNNVYTGASSSVAVKRNYSRFLVIKYID